MSLPGFTAELSTYRSRRSCRTSRTSTVGAARVEPAWDYCVQDQYGTTACTGIHDYGTSIAVGAGTGGLIGTGEAPASAR
jgi:hypothetical protein